MPEQHAATHPDQLLPREKMIAMSGLDFMRGILEGLHPGPPIATTLNFRLRAVDPGLVVFTGTPEFAAMNPMGSLHGGWYGAILDSCMACAVMTTLPAGSYYTTLEYRVNIIRAIPLGTAVNATGTLQHAGRSTGIARGEITGIDDGKLYATGSTTCLIMQV
jgi:uncharacterized protein (TIGR00369 family)